MVFCLVGETTVWDKVHPTEQVKTFDVGNQFACAILRDNSSECWGYISSIPYDDAFSDISAGDSKTCGVFEKDVFCWDTDGIVDISALSEGLQALYYEISGWSSIQDFANYTPYESETITSEINDSSFSTLFGSGRGTNVAALIEGLSMLMVEVMSFDWGVMTDLFYI